jgi:hypothetical protein
MDYYQNITNINEEFKNVNFQGKNPFYFSNPILAFGNPENTFIFAIL